jgi:hypothetical protein
MSYTVVIAERNEPDLKATVADIHENSAADVIVCSDRQGKGPQRMRHEGIMQASSDVVIVMDGHMRIQPGALDIVAESVKDGQAVSCARCHHHHELTFEGSGYGGAKIVWAASEPGGNFWALPGKWRETAEPGPIGCVMGACYAVRRDWYIDGLGAPWQFGTGWGVDEEVISITNWLAGGENLLADAHVWHRARVQSEVPYELNPVQAAGLWANRFRILDMLPMHQSDREELVQHMMQNRFGRDKWGLIRRTIEKTAPAVDEYRNKLDKASPRTWDDWKRTWLDKEDQKPMNIMTMRKNLMSRTGAPWKLLMTKTKAELEDIWTGKSTMEIPPPAPTMPKKKKRRALIEVADSGYPCPHCGHRYDHKHKRSLPHNRHAMQCGNKSTRRDPDGTVHLVCGRNFIRRKTHA